jgi:murein DD-endopeptidase MepM/ murein hydrolase activator NlpD
MRVDGGAIDPRLTLAATPEGLDDRTRLAGKTPHQIALEFESVLVAQLVSAMRSTVPQSDLLEASTSRRVLDGAFDQEMARALSGRGGLGVAAVIERQLDPHAGTASTAPSLRPVDGRLSSGFGLRPDPFTGETRFHAGVDLAAPAGSEVRAVASGTVAFAGRRGDAGNVVDIHHADGTTSTYAHLESALVQTGDAVAAGRPIARVGSSGRSTGPHLHFAVSRDGQPLDPSGLLQALSPITGDEARDAT